MTQSSFSKTGSLLADKIVRCKILERFNFDFIAFKKRLPLG
jgi:hypothetical protein